MKEKVGMGAIIFVVLMLVIALGYIVTRNSSGITNLFTVSGGNDSYGGEDSVSSGKESSSASISIIFPKSGDILQQGNTYAFSWTGGGPVVTLSIAEGLSFSSTAVEWKAENIKNTGSYLFYVPTSLSGRYVLQVNDGAKKGYSKAFTVAEKQTSGGWSVFSDPQHAFEIQYPAKIRVAVLSQKNIYPQKQYDVTVPDFIRGTSLSSGDYSKKLPVVSILIFGSNGQNLDAWLASHSEIKTGYSSQTKRNLPGGVFYKFSSVKPNLKYRQGEPIYTQRHDVPQEMWVTIFGTRAYAILVDFGSSGKYTISPEEIIKTFRAY